MSEPQIDDSIEQTATRLERMLIAAAKVADSAHQSIRNRRNEKLNDERAKEAREQKFHNMRQKALSDLRDMRDPRWWHANPSNELIAEKYSLARSWLGHGEEFTDYLKTMREQVWNRHGVDINNLPVGVVAPSSIPERDRRVYSQVADPDWRQNASLEDLASVYETAYQHREDPEAKVRAHDALQELRHRGALTNESFTVEDFERQLTRSQAERAADEEKESRVKGPNAEPTKEKESRVKGPNAEPTTGVAAKINDPRWWNSASLREQAQVTHAAIAAYTAQPNPENTSLASLARGEMRQRYDFDPWLPPPQLLVEALRRSAAAKQEESTQSVEMQAQSVGPEADPAARPEATPEERAAQASLDRPESTHNQGSPENSASDNVIDQQNQQESGAEQER